MLKFSIEGELNNYVKITLTKVYGFPDSTSPFGGYDTESLVEIKSSNYSINGLLWVTTGNIYDFYSDLKKCQEQLSGVANLKSYENNLVLKLEYDLLGHVYVSGEFREKHDENNVLGFGFLTDQTFIKKAIEELYEIHFKYGDNFGLGKNKMG